MAFSPHHVVPDSPINNFCTLNPSPTKMMGYGRSDTISEGNLIVKHTASNYGTIGSTISIPSSGKWYVECNFKSVAGAGANSAFGISTVGLGDNLYVYDTPYAGTGVINKYTDGTATTTQGVGVATAGDIVSIFIDADSGTAQIKKNNIDVSTPYTMSSEGVNYYILYQGWAHSGDGFIYNFGQDPTFGGSKSPTTTYPDANGLGQFHFQPPAGAMALCTANLPEGPIKLSQDQTPSDHFKALTWIGDNAGQRSIPHNMPEAPDLVWIKNRDHVSMGHTLFDSVRGYGANEIISNHTSAEGSYSGAYGYVDSVDDTNINLTDGNAAAYDDRLYTNYSGQKYVGWCWRAAGSPANNQAKIINEDGTQADTTCAALASAAGASITPSKVSANRQNGFSIVSATIPTGSGKTVPHGFDRTPDLIIWKSTNLSTNWEVYHKDLTPNSERKLYLNTSGGVIDSGFMNDTPPTSSVFSINVGSNQSNHIFYCWHSVAGYSKCGSYVGNGSPDGSFVYTGFRPAFVMIKSTSSGRWVIFDSARSPYNIVHHELFADESWQEHTTDDDLDFLSNGFKIRRAAVNFGATSKEYVFMAFAEQPFSGPSNAR